MFRWSIIEFNRKQLVVNHCIVNNQLKHISSDKIGKLYMNKHLRRIFLLLITFALSTRVALAQTTFASEEELKTQAAKLFDDDEFEEAYPLYSQLTSIYPKDPNYNYRLGVCMLYASDDKEKPIPFLEFAAGKPEVEKEVFFYLARAYHLNYRFDDAIKQYVAYKNVASSAKAEKLMVDRQIEMCKNGKKLLRNLTDLVVIEKKEMSRTDFFRSYDISDIGGKLLVKPDEDVFKTSLDKKKKEKSIIYLASNNNQVFFSSYGDNPDNGKDIYIIRKLPTGEWSKPQTLGYPVNTEYDEDFPFLHPNGKVLYFCSKGHNSMGGYDIFKTTLNEETNTWNKPVNLDFPINTPDDDILYVTNEDEKEAYFSSARASKTGKTAVYHINVERKPIDIAIIKGAVVKNREGQALDVKITVKDLNDNEILGIFNAKAANGVYLINIPNGGKFLFTVEATGFATQSDVVDVPVQYVFKPMKQEISYEAGTDKLIIKNMFDEEMDESSYLLALNFIKEKSKMDVNATTADASNSTSASKDTSIDNNTQTTAVADKTKVTPGTKLTNDDIVKIAYSDADDVDKEAKDIKEQADVALALANQKNELAQNKAKEATQLMADANSMTDNVKKQATIDEATTASADADELNQETVAAFNLAKKLDFRANSKQEEADLSKQYAKDLEAAVKSKNPGDALAKLDDQQKKLDALSEQNNNPTFVNSLKMDADNKKKELDKATQTSQDIKQEISDNEKLIITTQADADKEKNDKVKQGLLDQITGLKQDTEESKSDLALNETKVNQLQKDYNGIINETQLVGSVLDKAKFGTSENAAAIAATVNKAKLEQEVNTIKNSPVVASTKTTDNAVKDNSTKTTDVAVTTPVTDNTVKDNTVKTTDGVVTTPTTDNIVKDNTTKITDAVVATQTTDNTVKDNTTKTSDAVVTTPATDNTVKDNTTKTTDAVVDNTTPTKDNSVVPEDYNKKYTDEIVALDKIDNEKDRENKKAELYKTWTASINDDLTAKKTEAKAEKDKTKKKELNQDIADLEKALKTKQQQTSTALASADKLNKQTSDVAVSTTDITATDNTTSIPVVTPATINKKYSVELASTDNITNPADRETAKADALKKWSVAIDADIAKKKQDMDASSDPEMKALLAVKIKDAEEFSKEKQDLANESLAKAEKIKNPNAVVTAPVNDNTVKDNTIKTTDVVVTTPVTDNSVKDNTTKTTDNTVKDNTTKTTDAVVTTPVTDNTVKDNTTKTTDVAVTTPVTDNTVKDNATKTTDNTTPSEVSTAQKLNNDIANADKSATDLERENKKVDAYTQYIAATNETLTQTKEDLKAEKDKTKKKELTATITSLESDIKEKQTALDNSFAKVKTLQQTNAVVDNTTTAPVNPDSTDNETEPSTKQFVYVSTSANEQATKADNLNKEAEQLTTQANELKTKAANETNADDKNAGFAKAEELDKQAESKKIESAQLAGTANKTEYNNNQNALNQLAAASANNKADDISIAEMMKDESKIYFDKAQKSRDFAATTNSFDEKQSALDDAYKNEMIALEKQQKATKIYKKYNQSFVATNNTTVVPAITTSVKTTDNTAVATTTTPTTDNTKSTTTTTPVKDSATAVKTTDVVTTPVTDNTVKDNTTKTTTVPVTDNTKTTITPTTDIVKTTTTTPATTTKLASTEVFVTKSAKVYSAAKPIPVNEKLPEGLVFKVQIGAFRNPIPQDLFKGMSPITGETTPQGFTRYTAGLFTKYATADKVKDEIRGLGYKDAFVVAFLNGKRISIAEALTMTGEQMSSSETATTTTPVVDNTVATTPSTTVTTPATTTTVVKQPTTTPTNPADVAVTQSVSVVSGLFYTIQIGVFSQPPIASKLHNVQPIYSETAPNGNLRYNVGIYNNVGRATEAKNMIIDAGMKDAFITAYSNGKRISMPEAAQLEKDGTSVFSTASNMNVLPTFSGAAPKQTPVETTTPKNVVTPVTTPKVETEKPATHEQPTTTTTEPVTTEKPKPETTTTETTHVATAVVTPIVKTNIPMPIDSGIVFKVQIGAFKDEVPLYMANKFLKIAKKGIHNYNDENGLTIYSVGVFRAYDEANKVKGEVATEADINDAFIVAYKDGVKISVEDAKTLINK
jgi:hypothetical protein